MSRTIETAPKHGGWVLLWADGMKPQPFYWSERLSVWVQSDEENPVHWSGGPDDCGPTHWAPIPSAAEFDAIQTLSDAADEINGEIDRQIYDECLRLEDVPPDYEFHVVIEHKQLTALNAAICGVQSMLPKPPLPDGVSVRVLEASPIQSEGASK